MAGMPERSAERASCGASALYAMSVRASTDIAVGRETTMPSLRR